MAYKFPWTNYHELNLDWILDTVKKLFAQTEQNNEIVTQYDGRLTEVELTADNAQTAAGQALENSTAALDLAQGAQTTATQAQQAAGQAQTAAGQAQTAAGQALEAAATAQQTATQAQQTAHNFDGRITQAENNAANALQAAQAFDEQVQGAITAANNANEAATTALTTATEANHRSAETAQELANQRDTLESIIENAEVDLTTKAPVIINTADGDIASFNDGADDMPIKELVVNIEPAQDLNGYDNPWPAGGGKNLIPLTIEAIKTASGKTWTDNSCVVNGVTFTILTDDAGNVSAIRANGTASSNAFLRLSKKDSGGDFLIAETGYTLNGCPSGGGNNSYRLQLTDDVATTHVDTGAGRSFTPSASFIEENYSVAIRIASGYTANNVVFYPMIRLATDTDATFAPYSNICPISGRTEAEIYHETEYDADADPKIYVTFPSEAGTIYGGILTINPDRTGALVVDRRFIIIDGVNNMFTGGYGENDANRLPAFILGSGENRAVNIGSGHIANYLKYNIYAASRNSFAIGNSGQLIVAHINDIMGNDGTYGYNSDAELFSAANAYVTDNPLQICYTLATPINYILTESEISAFLSTLYGANAIWTDVGSVNVEYPADTKLYIDNKFAELQALILEH